MNTTHIYLDANLELKEQALAKTEALQVRLGRCRPPDRVLVFLQAL